MSPDSNEVFDLNVWVDNWNREIELWLQDPEAYWKGHRLSSCYNGTGKSIVIADCLPEPYLGDPDASRYSAVFLNLNPGQPHRNFQAHHNPEGLYTKRVREIGYKEWAKINPYTTAETVDGGRTFWTTRIRWANEMAGGFLGQETLPSFCLELFPFHSDCWGDFNVSLAKEWIETWVLKPAVSLAHRAEIPAVICVGKSFKDLFMYGMKLDPDVIIGTESDPKNFLDNWPKKSTGEPLNRTFLRFKAHGGTFLVTYHPGGNKLPGPRFKEVCHYVLSHKRSP